MYNPLAPYSANTRSQQGAPAGYTQAPANPLAGMNSLAANPLLNAGLAMLGASSARPGNSPYTNPLIAGLGGLQQAQHAQNQIDRVGLAKRQVGVQEKSYELDRDIAESELYNKAIVRENAREQLKRDDLTPTQRSYYQNQELTGEVKGNLPEAPNDIREYEYAVDRGYKGSFPEWQTLSARASANILKPTTKEQDVENMKARGYDPWLAEGIVYKTIIKVQDQWGKLLELFDTRKGEVIYNKSKGINKFRIDPKDKALDIIPDASAANEPDHEAAIDAFLGDVENIVPGLTNKPR